MLASVIQYRPALSSNQDSLLNSRAVRSATSNRMEPAYKTEADRVRISCYMDEIPCYIETELQRLYGHVHSSLAYIRVYKPVDHLCAYVARQGDRPISILLFQYRDGRIDVLNEMVKIDETELLRFVTYMLAEFKSVDVISFLAIQTDLHSFPYPFQRHNAKESFSLALPATPDEYTARLGKATRRNIKRYTRKITTDFPSFHFHHYTGSEIDEGHIREIIRLSKARISVKKKKFGIDESETQRIIRLAGECGEVTIIWIGGRVAAGTITFRVGVDYLAEVNAHDPAFDAYWLGTLCYYLAICQSIVRGGRTFYLGCGRYEYKKRLLGVRQDMDRLDIYRSYPRLMLRFDWVAKVLGKAYFRRLKVWLLERENTLITRVVIYFLYILRKLKLVS